MYLTDLDDALRAARCGFWESPGWQNRGHGGMAGVRGILIHHTAGGGPNDWKIVQNGRSDLPGPLAQMTLERDGGVRLLAAGQCWHSGNGSHPGVGGAVGNAWLIGIEGVSPGVGAGAWTGAQRTAYPYVAAALCRWYRLPASAVVGHKEYALPRGRKIDPGEWDMNQFRAEVERHLRGTPAPPPPREEDELNEIEKAQLAKVNEQETKVLSSGNHHGNDDDNQLGHTVSAHKFAKAALDKVTSLEAKFDAFIASQVKP